MTEKNKTLRAFNLAASTYDKNNDIQEDIFQVLVSTLPQQCYGAILDLGCASGRLTKKMADQFPLAKILGIDQSSSMIDQAKRTYQSELLSFKQQAIQTVKFTTLFDLIIAHSSLHWVSNMKQWLPLYHQQLSQNGYFACSVFLPGAFSELEDCMQRLYNKEIKLPATDFRTIQNYESHFKSIFSNVTITQKMHSKSFISLIELLRWIKCLGINGGGSSIQISWTRKQCYDIEQCYIKSYGSITATFPIAYIICEK